MSKRNTMRDSNLTLERRAYILSQIDKAGSVFVNELSEMYSVSLVTIRKDLTHLEKKGLLIKTRGGAVKNQTGNFALSFNQKLKQGYKPKQLIGVKAIEFISEGDTIIMDSGTTTLEIAKNLIGFKSIKVIINSLPIADFLSDKDGVEVFMLAGRLRKEMHSLVGHLAEHTLSKLYSNIAFIGVDGIDCDSGLYTPDIEEAALAQAMINRSKTVIVVADSTKFSRTSMSFIAGVDQIDYIITDKDIPEKQAQGFIDKGVKIVIA